MHVLQDEDGDSVYSQARYRLPVPMGDVTVVRILLFIMMSYHVMYQKLSPHVLVFVE